MDFLRGDRQTPHAINEVWAMDFVADQLANGQRLRLLTGDTDGRAAAAAGLADRAAEAATRELAVAAALDVEARPVGGTRATRKTSVMAGQF